MRSNLNCRSDYTVVCFCSSQDFVRLWVDLLGPIFLACLGGLLYVASHMVLSSGYVVTVDSGLRSNC